MKRDKEGETDRSTDKHRGGNEHANNEEFCV